MTTVETQLLHWHHAPIKLVKFMLCGVHCSPPHFKTSSYAYDQVKYMYMYYTVDLFIMFNTHGYMYEELLLVF